MLNTIGYIRRHLLRTRKEWAAGILGLLVGLVLPPATDILHDTAEKISHSSLTWLCLGLLGTLIVLIAYIALLVEDRVRHKRYMVFLIDGKQTKPIDQWEMEESSYAQAKRDFENA